MDNRPRENLVAVMHPAHRAAIFMAGCVTVLTCLNCYKDVEICRKTWYDQVEKRPDGLFSADNLCRMAAQIESQVRNRIRDFSYRNL